MLESNASRFARFQNWGNAKMKVKMLNKIFISHNQEYQPAKHVKFLINALGAYGILVEDEPGSESPDKKSFRYLKDSHGFLAICTPDLRDEKDAWAPRHNVILEIQEWQKAHKAKNMVILKDKRCSLPVLLGNPTFHEFEGDGILSAVCQVIKDFVAIDLIPDKFVSDSEIPQIEFTDKEKKALIYLAGATDRRYYSRALHKYIEFGQTEWNMFLHKGKKYEFYYQTQVSTGAMSYDTIEAIQLTDKGFEYLIQTGMIQ